MYIYTRTRTRAVLRLTWASCGQSVMNIKSVHWYEDEEMRWWPYLVWKWMKEWTKAYAPLTPYPNNRISLLVTIFKLIIAFPITIYAQIHSIYTRISWNVVFYILSHELYV